MDFHGPSYSTNIAQEIVWAFDPKTRLGMYRSPEEFCVYSFGPFMFRLADGFFIY
jgi:hypothetical protein